MRSKSVARPLVAVYGVLIGLLIIAVLIGTLAVRDLREPLRVATESGLETSVAGRELRGAIDVLEQIIANRSARSQSDAAAYRREAEAQCEEVVAQSQRLTQSAIPSPALEEVRSQIPALVKQVDTITALESALAASRDATSSKSASAQSAASQAIGLTREHASSFFANDAKVTRRFADIRYSLSTISQHSQTAASSDDLDALRAADGLYASYLRRAVYEVSLLPAYADKNQLSKTLSSLFEIGRSGDNLFNDANLTMQLREQLDQQLATFRQQIVRLQITSRQISSDNDASTARTLQAAQAGLERYQWALIIASILTAILGFGVLRRYVYDAVVVRLRRLSATTTRLSHGDLSTSVDIDGHDEISDVAGALEVFRQNARDLAASEKALAKRTLELEEVNRELDDFAYVASHDLRAPLHGVDSLASFVQEDLGTSMPEESARHLELMRARIKRLHGLLDALLEYSRIGRKEFKPETVDLDKLVRECASLFDKTGFDIDYDLKVGEVSILATPFEQVVRNLVDNAIKHHDQPQGQITIRTRREDDDILMDVGDDGPGIPAEYHERIFGMFQTLKARDSVEGSGMGLTFLRKAVNQNGGSIVIESDPSQARGTVFKVRWPLNKKNAT